MTQAAANSRIPPPDWSAARRLVPTPPDGRINLNSGTLSPTPHPIARRANELRESMAASPSNFVWRVGGPLITESRRQLAAYFNVPPEELLLLPNVTYAINLVTASLHLGRAAEVLTTDHEYGAMLYAWERAAAERDMRIRHLTLPYLAEDPAEIVEAFEAAFAPDTRVLFFSHVATSTGLVLPAAEICAAARRRGIITVVDGAHAPGTIPLDLAAIGADFYAANGHKWLMTPASSGFMHVRAHHRRDIKPLVTSWGYYYDPSKAHEQSPFGGGTHWQCDLEFHGTADRIPQMLFPECLALRQSLGGESAMFDRYRDLSGFARETLAAAGLTPSIPANPALRSALASVHIPSADAVATRDRLWHEFGIECPVTVAAGKTYLRVSTNWWNTEDEIKRLAAAATQLT